MSYDFDRIIDRKNTDSVKWDGVDKTFDGNNLIPLWVADMDFRCPDIIIEKIKERADHGIFGYNLCPSNLDEAFISWMERRHDCKIKKEWITYSPGVLTSLSHAISSLTEVGDKIIIQSPVYPPFYNIVKNNKREILVNPLKLEDNSYKMDFIDLDKKMAEEKCKALILCSPHNPIGRVWKEEELLKLSKLCEKHGIILISDEIHSDLILPTYKHTTSGSVSKYFRENSISLMAPSKTFNMPGLTASLALIANPKLRLKFQEAMRKSSIGMGNTFSIIAMEAAYRHGDKWLDSLLKYLKGNYDFLENFIDERLGEIKLIKTEGTYLAWLDFRELGLDKDELKVLLNQDAGVALNDGLDFGLEGEGFRRLNFACPRSILEEALIKIEIAIQEWRKSK